MANWCSNNASFNGTEPQLKELGKFFKAMAKKEKKEGLGQMPDFYKSDYGYLFEIEWNHGELRYMTKWGPNIDVIVAIAKQFEVDFTIEFDEPGMRIYGECSFLKGELEIFELEQSDYEQFSENPDNEDTWLFEGNVYQSEFEILEELLDRKKRKSLG